MAKWRIGTQVVTRPNTVLSIGDKNDPAFPIIPAGTYGIIVAIHGTARDADGRFAQVVTMRYHGNKTVDTCTDELYHVGEPVGFVSDAEVARAELAYARHSVDVAERVLAMVERGDVTLWRPR